MGSLVIILVLVIVFTGVREWISLRNREERKELYDRIMAGNLTEFQSTQKQEPPKGRGFMRKATARHEAYVKKLREEGD